MTTGEARGRQGESRPTTVPLGFFVVRTGRHEWTEREGVWRRPLVPDDAVGHEDQFVGDRRARAASYWSEAGRLIKEKGVAQRCDQKGTGPQNRLSRLGCSRRATRWGSGPASPEGWSVSFGKSRRTTTSSARSFWLLPRGSRFRVATSG